MRNHGPVVGETQPEPLREGGDDKLHLGEREGVADTEPWAASEGNVGVPRPAGCAGGCPTIWLKGLRPLPKEGMAV